MGLHLRAPCMEPHLLSIAPSSGATGGGTAITFAGYHLLGSSYTPIVYIGTSQCTGVAVSDDSTMTATTATQSGEGVKAVHVTHGRNSNGGDVVIPLNFTRTA